MMVGLDPERVSAGAWRFSSDQPRGSDAPVAAGRRLQMPNVSDKVVRIILSYTDYVRRVVWHET